MKKTEKSRKDLRTFPSAILGSISVLPSEEAHDVHNLVEEAGARRGAADELVEEAAILDEERPVGVAGGESSRA